MSAVEKNQHAKFSPSAAARWIACPRSISMTEGMEDESGPYAEEGTRAHDLAEIYASGKTPDNEEDYPEDMREHARFYADYVRALAEDGGEIHLEKRVFITDDFHGTADAVIVNELGYLDVIDYKYGFNPVYPEENPQCCAYALGALIEHRNKCPLAIRIHIVQPRTSPKIKVWEIPDIGAFEREWTERFLSAIALAESDDPPVAASLDCYYCLALTTCQTYRQAVIDRAIEEFSSVDGIEDVGELVSLYNLRATVKKFYDTIGARLLRAAESGAEIPGYRLAESLGNREWSLSEDEIVKKLKGKRLKVDDIFDKKLKGPAKIEKILDKDFVASLVTRKSRGFSLVEEKSPKKSAKTAREEFGAVNTEV